MEDFNTLLTDFGDSLLLDLYSNLDYYGFGQSNLAQSLNYEIDSNRITVTAAPYWEYAQQGRGPGKTPYNFVDILVTWMRQYGITPMKGNEVSFGWAIKKKTEKEGSSIWRGDRPTRDFDAGAVDRNVEELKKKIATTTIEKFNIPTAM